MSAMAEQWYVEPSVRANVFYDDNIGLRSEDKESSSGVAASADVTAGRRTETTDIGLSAEVVAERYFDASDYNVTDFFFDFAAAHKRQHDLFGLDASFDYDSTLTSEIETTGIVRDNQRRSRWYLGPSWTRSLTERLNAQLYAGYASVSYEDDAPGLEDYTNVNLGLLGTYLVSETMQATGRVMYDRYESDTTDRTTDAVGVSIGVRNAFSETLSGFVELGARHAEYDLPTGIDQSDTNTGPLANIGLDWRRETGRWSFLLGRSLLPSGSGLVDTTSARVSGRENLSERWAALLDVNAIHNRYDLQGGDDNTRDFVSLQPKIRYKLTEWWEIEGSYRYRWQDYERRGDEPSADGNLVYLSISYTWPREPLGRWSELR